MARNILIAVVVLVIIAVAGFFIIEGRSSQPTTSQIQNTPTNEVPTMATTEATTSAPSTQNTVSIENFSFNPGEITVKAGTEVTWTNNDSTIHTVTSDTNAFQSGNIAPGATFKFTFSQAGTFSYHCSIHSSMTGKVIVQ